MKCEDCNNDMRNIGCMLSPNWGPKMRSVYRLYQCDNCKRVKLTRVTVDGYEG